MTNVPQTDGCLVSLREGLRSPTFEADDEDQEQSHEPAMLLQVCLLRGERRKAQSTKGTCLHLQLTVETRLTLMIALHTNYAHIIDLEGNVPLPA